MITKLAFIGHPTRDLERARRFYQETLGLEVDSQHPGGGSVELRTPEGKAIALETYSPEGAGPYMALETDDLVAEIKRLKAEGTRVIQDTWENPGCKMALIADPDGHVIMLHEVAAHRK